MKKRIIALALVIVAVSGQTAVAASSENSLSNFESTQTYSNGIFLDIGDQESSKPW